MKRPADRRLICKARNRLMKVLGWDEPTAYHAIRKAAMDDRAKMVEIAKRVLNAGENVLAVVETPQAPVGAGVECAADSPV